MNEEPEEIEEFEELAVLRTDCWSAPEEERLSMKEMLAVVVDSEQLAAVVVAVMMLL